jgi:asparagine synthase (glutamine-hydrolysing)
MGFPTPVNDWVRGEARDFVHDTLSTTAARSRALVDNRQVLRKLETEPRFGRNVWGLLCLEIWQQEFHDRAAESRRVAAEPLAV